jgi:Mg-chelatase subunit ChlD
MPKKKKKKEINTEDVITDIVCILDRSGSMEAMKTEAITGYNEFLRKQKEEKGKANVTLVLFNKKYRVIHKAEDIQKAPELTDKTFVPVGSTALLDAVGKAVEEFGNSLREREVSEQPDRVIFSIMTDGMENASENFTRDQIAKLIKDRKKKNKWEFVFLAAGQNAILEGGRLGIGRGQSINYAASARGIETSYLAMSDTVSSYRNTGQTVNWNSEGEELLGIEDSK